MNFEGPVYEGRLLRRYKRFLADIELAGGEIVTAHCANSGSMEGCKTPGSAVLLTKSDDPKRKLAYSWELVRVGRTWVGINTARPNRIVEGAIRAGRIPELRGYAELRREVPYGKNSRIDLLLEDPRKPRCFVEVKNVTLADGKLARFPDAVTTRGQKHLGELMQVAKKGERAVGFYLVNRADCDAVAPADAVDPEYGRLLRKAAAAGVELLAYRTRWDKKGVAIEGRVPVVLD